MYSEKEIIRKVESLAEKIGKLEVVQDYHNVEKQIHNNQAIKQDESFESATKTIG